ncbi:MAG: EamA family transporter [Ilumatobacteraceae bacterium]
MIDRRGTAVLAGAPPEALFVVGATSQYVGAVIAVSIFDEMGPAPAAFVRVLSASLILLAVSAPRIARDGMPRGRELAGIAIFGVVTALMNLTFYLAIARLDLGKGVAIEFVGPIAVAAARTRTTRNVVALAAAALGVVVLSGLEIDDEPLGVLFIFLAAACWAAYIVLGARIARQDRGMLGLGLGLAFGAVAIVPFSLGDVAVFTSLRLLALCALVGLLSNAVGYGIDQVTLRRIPVRRFSVLLALLPVTATVMGAVFLDQTPSVAEMIGIAFVLVGVVVQERETFAPAA